MREYSDNKPIPKYKKGDMVYRRWCGMWMHHAEPISRVFVKEYNGKWCIDYYFPRERTAYSECELYATLEDILRAEAEYEIRATMGKLHNIKLLAKKHNIALNIDTQKLLEQ